MAKIVYKQDNLDLLNQKLNKISASFSSVSTVLSPLANHSVIGEGVSSIKNNTSVLDARAKGNASIVMKGQDSFNSNELINEKLIDQIEIPTDLKNVYSPTDTETDQVDVNKKDGRSVNEGEASHADELSFEDLVDEEKLKDITNQEGNEKEYDDNYKEKEKELKNILNKEGQQEELEDYKETEEQVLNEMNTDADTDNKEFNDAYGIRQGELSDINNNADTEEKHLEGFEGMNQGGLSSINNNANTEEQKFDDSFQGLSSDASKTDDNKDDQVQEKKEETINNDEEIIKDWSE